MKCNDCGRAFEMKRTEERGRHDVCDDCWKNRTWLVNNARLLPPEKFMAIQKAMGYGRGTAKRKIEALKLSFTLPAAEFERRKHA